MATSTTYNAYPMSDMARGLTTTRRTCVLFLLLE